MIKPSLCPTCQRNGHGCPIEPAGIVPRCGEYLPEAHQVARIARTFKAGLSPETTAEVFDITRPQFDAILREALP